MSSIQSMRATVNRYFCLFSVMVALLPPETKWRQGILFTPVCDSVHGEVSVQGGLCPGESLSGGVSVQGRLCPGRPLAPVRLRAGGTHPTGMHLCLQCVEATKS